MTHHSFKLLAFDFDGTLADSSANIVAAAKHAFAAFGAPYPGDEAVTDTIGLKLLDCARRWLPAGSEAEVTDLAQLYVQGFTAVRAAPDFHEPLFEGVQATLDHLQHDEVFMAVCTGKNLKGLEYMLGYHGIGHYFHSLQTPDTNAGKPAPDMVISALSDTGVDPQACVVIGDTSYDMMMARSAGAKAIGVTYGHHSSQHLEAAGAQILINAIDELPQALEALSS